MTDDVRVATWERLQDMELESYRASFRAKGTHLGYFSVPEFVSTVYIAKLFERELQGKVLDIGCGILKRPAYMPKCDHIEFHGIDPFEGEYERDFEFKQATGEQIPYPDNTFTAALFMSSLDHTVSPLKSLHEAHRVLKQHGKLYVWTMLKPHSDPHYRQWKASGGLFDDHHQWAFSQQDLQECLVLTGFEFQSILKYEGDPLGTYVETWLIRATAT